MRQLVSDQFTVQEDAHPLCFVNQKQHEVRVYILSDTLFRVGYAVTQAERDALDEYGQQLGIKNKAGCKYTVSRTALEGMDTIIIETKALRVHVTLCPFGMTWYDVADDDKVWIAKDLAHRSYCHDPVHNTRWHYQQQPENAFLYGLGERTGRLNLAGRRFRLERTDAMGYDASQQNPLYKFVPFYLGISVSGSTARAYGMYYHQLGQTTLDFGQEKDAMWGNYSYYTIEGGGPLMYSMMYGPDVPSVVRALHEYMGGYQLMPKSLFGYLASAMGYAESDNAQALLAKFVTDCRDVHDIPCDGMHLSSGYTVDPAGNRCVFTWNKERFPDPAGLAKLYKDNGMRLIANIKPWLLATHPDYERVASEHGLVWQPSEDGVDDQPATLWQWRAGANTKGLASYIDFTSKAGYAYWQEKATSALLELGYDLWLDNNEFTLTDEAQSFKNEITWTQYPDTMAADYKLSVASRACIQKLGIANMPSAIQTSLMIQASFDAVRAQRPNERVCLVTRSSVPYAQRLVAHTWSGDNYTSWDTVAYNIPMGTGACLSAMPAGYGHDIGGFAGPKCSREMLIRWVQQGITWTRCCIHSYKPEGQLTEPWMYPDALPVIRDALKWRYRFIPYLYSLYVTSAFRDCQPVVRPTFYDHQHDVNTYQQDFEYMLGRDILVAPVYEPDVVERRAYLPDVAHGWYHYQTSQFYAGGQFATVPSALDDPVAPMFLKAGSLVCFGKSMPHVNAVPDDERRIHVYPATKTGAKSARTSLTLIDDDGVTLDHERCGKYSEICVWMESDDDHITIGIESVHNQFKIAYEKLLVACPVPNETRSIVIAGLNDQTTTESLADDHNQYTVVPLS